MVVDRERGPPVVRLQRHDRPVRHSQGWLVKTSAVSSGLPHLCGGVRDCIELLYIPKHVGWYVQLCIAVAECCDTTTENEEMN